PGMRGDQRQDDDGGDQGSEDHRAHGRRPPPSCELSHMRRFARLAPMQTLSLLLSLLLVPAHAKAKDPADEISAKRLLDTIKEFSSDYYEGRGPGTRGEERSLAYLTKRFKEIGLAPGNPDGTY